MFKSNCVLAYRRTLFCFLACLPFVMQAQNQANDYQEFTKNFLSWQQTLQEAKPKAVEKWWAKRKKNQQIPYCVADSVVLFYKAPANQNPTQVEWAGDFTGWRPSLRGTQIGKSRVWYCKLSLPKDARIDYKIVLNGKDWQLDEGNPHQQWAGIGGGAPNSELRMPEWKPETWAMPTQNSKQPKGNLSANLLINSTALGYAVQYKVYVPANYDQLKDLPVVYFTDGQEYADPRMGAAVVTLDNLIAAQKINPVIAVFIDPRQPNNLNENRRMTEYINSDKFLGFVTKELIPTIDKTYKTNPSAAQRALVGTSLGGLCATYFAWKANDSFQLFVVNSPAYWVSLSILDNFKTTKIPFQKLYLSSGLQFDGEKDTQLFKQILTDKGYNFRYQEINQGHSWGNWKGLVDDWLLYFFGK